MCIIEDKDLNDCSGILMQVFAACRVHSCGVLGEGISMKTISDLKSKNSAYRSILRALISKYILALGLIILFETFVCNYLFFRNIGNDEIVYAIEDSADSGIIYNNLTVAEPGVLCVDSNEDVYIELDGLNVPGKDLYIDLEDILWIGESQETSADFLIKMTDESHHRFYNRGGIKTISALIEQTKYISLRSMGQMNDLRIEFKNVETGDFVYIDSIVVNRKRPLFFSLGRVFLFFILFLAAYHLRSGSRLYKSKYDMSIRWQRWVTCITVILILYICLQLSGYLTQAAGTGAACAETKANLGLLALQQGDVKTAENYIGQAGNANGLAETLGNLHLAQGNYALAEQDFNGVNSNSAALAQILNKNYAKAAQTLKNVKNADGMTDYLQAIVNARQGNADSAQSFLRSAIQKDASLKAYADNDLEFKK